MSLDRTSRAETDSTSAALLREMNEVGGGLFTVGGSLVLFVLLIGRWDGVHRPTLAVTSTVAILAGLTLTFLSRRHPLPRPIISALAVLGTLNITATIVGAGPEGAAAFGVLYVFVTVFSFYYFSFRLAATQVALTAVAFAVTLQLVHVADPSATWLIVTGGNVIIGLLIGRGGNRMRDLLESERVATARLRELDELRTAFLRAVSHELRTPLTAVIGNAETLRDRRHLLDELQIDMLITRIGTNGHRLQRLITNLLDIDRISRGVVQAVREPTDMDILVRRTVQDLACTSHLIEVDSPGETLISLEASKVERIVENLVGNAVRHTPSGTHVRVTLAEHGSAVLLTVEDDGPGVPNDARERIFAPFEQGQSASNSPNPGTGIGLALVAKFTELHDGRAWVETSSLGGAAFHVRLPRADTQAPLSSRTPVPVGSA